ncbi:hypothetical protein GCM10025880_47420 [Methylorubrum aminovorans]|nr:hypothetical protein GCM10025880_47420 [Methylorubrum aminovorans]
MTTGSASEAERLAALHALRILDSDPEAQFDAVCRTAQRLFGVAVAYISLVDAERQWLKACAGTMPIQTPREDSFCDRTIEQDALLVVSDARRDPRFSALGIVTGPPHVVFYAGAPLTLRPGVQLGSLCLIDPQPRDFTPDDAAALRDLAEIVTAQMRLRRDNLAFASERALRQIHESTIRAQGDEIERRASANSSSPWPSRSPRWATGASISPAATRSTRRACCASPVWTRRRPWAGIPASPSCAIPPIAGASRPSSPRRSRAARISSSRRGSRGPTERSAT